MISLSMLEPLLIGAALLSTSIFIVFLKKQKSKTADILLTGEWSIDLLMAIEWKRYEEICREFLAIKEKGRFNVDVTKTGADGGIDLRITDKRNRLIGVGQCKAYNSIIGVATVRELFGVMASEKVEMGYFFTTSTFSNDAISFADKNKITLINGRDQLKTIKSFTNEQQNNLYKNAVEGDYKTPSCPNCDKKMVNRVGKENGKKFWGCSNYPKCKNILQIRKS